MPSCDALMWLVRQLCVSAKHLEDLANGGLSSNLRDLQAFPSSCSSRKMRRPLPFQEAESPADCAEIKGACFVRMGHRAGDVIKDQLRNTDVAPQVMVDVILNHIAAPCPSALEARPSTSD